MNPDMVLTQGHIHEMTDTMRGILNDALKRKRAGALFPTRFHDILDRLRPRQRGRWNSLLRAIRERFPGKGRLARHGLDAADLDLKYKLLMERADRYRSVADRIDNRAPDHEFDPALKDSFGDFLDVSIVILGSLVDALEMKTPILEFIEILKLLLSAKEEESRPQAPPAPVPAW